MNREQTNGEKALLNKHNLNKRHDSYQGRVLDLRTEASREMNSSDVAKEVKRDVKMLKRFGFSL
ncbi:hypothetical protein HALA3H3_130043 [Halomonas sp. A3H3]|jgi:hypothetical protein|nr:hypothetical protein HALA3H3_130043 [Halomonas sp. A3H3]SDJ03218.1 hypothetical protein SAMN04487867_12139 [Halomonas titanicae]